ncbi:hypothetical protein OY671_008003, partial [Metschnikowia pulcherrima]
VSMENTTLYASDRDVFSFLVDDTHPIEAGKSPNGEPDLYFRGFYCWNSEVGSKSSGIATFYLRAVCMNRNSWGVENFEEINIRHSKFAANRFAHEATPALEHFADSSPRTFVDGIKQARERIVARKDDDREDFSRKRGFSKAETAKIITAVSVEEGHPPESLYDFARRASSSPKRTEEGAMPSFTIESTYRSPVFRQRTYEAATIGDACRLAIKDSDWTGQKEDYESCGPTYVTDIWPGGDTAYMVAACSVPTGFGEGETPPEPQRPDHPAEPSDAFPVMPRCRDCGSADICRDANACWDDAARAWSSLATYDNQTCQRCGA